MRYLALLALLIVAAPLRAEPEYPKAGPDIYDTQANGMAQVDEAIRVAKMEQKHVLIVFGAAEEGALARIVAGEKIGTLVSAG